MVAPGGNDDAVATRVRGAHTRDDGGGVTRGPRRADEFGQVEQAGVDFIPVAERTSAPKNLFRVFVGGNMAFSVVIFGWLPVTFGLTFWQAMSSIVVGLVIGLLLMVPMTLMGSRTGTNNPVSSGAHFGMRGRLIGSGLSLLFAIAYAAIAVWTSGEALVAGAHRLIGTPQTQWASVIGYALIAIEIVLIALYGHGTIVAIQKFIIPIAVVILVLGVIAFAPRFGTAHVSGGYLLGGFWPTWLYAVTISIGGPLSYAPSVGDYARRINPDRFSDRRIAWGACGGIFVGLLATAAFGAFTASGFTHMSSDYVADLVAYSPAWYIIPLLVVAVIGGCGQGVINVYASGLDLESIIPRLSRAQTTLITSAIAVAVMYLGVVAVNAVASITAMTVVLNALTGPWVVINGLGFLIARRRRYDIVAMQRYGLNIRGGRYWFTRGWNLRAAIPFVAGSIAGLLTVNNDLYQAPLAGIAGGVDISFPLSMAVSAVLYLLALRVWPETAVNDMTIGEDQWLARIA